MELMKEALLTTVSRLALQVGFEFSSLEAIELLVELLYRYLKSLSTSIADLSCDHKYSFLDGIAALGLRGESISDLVEFAREVGPFFPKPPNVCIPLQGRIQLNPPPRKDSTIAAPQSVQNESQENEIPAESSITKKDEAYRPLSFSIPRTVGHNYPPWANRSRYKLTCVSYDSTTGSLILHTPPPPITPVPVSNKASAKRRSSRSTASTFRRPHTSPLISDSEQNAVASQKRLRTDEEVWASAMAATISPTTATLKNVVATPVDIVSRSPDLKVSETAPPKRSLSGNRRPPIRKKTLASRRKRPLLAAKRFIPSQVPGSTQINLLPSVLVEKVDLHEVLNPRLTDILPQKNPSITDESIQPTTPDKPFVIGKTESFTVNASIPEPHVSTANTTLVDQRSPVSLPTQQTTPIQERLSVSSGSVFHDSPLRSPCGIVSPIKKADSSPKSPNVSSPHDALPPIVDSPDISAPSVASNRISQPLGTPIALDSDTEPMVCEEECRLFEMERFSKFSTNRRSNSTCSTAPSSSTISSSHSTTSSSRPSLTRGHPAKSRPNLSSVPQPPVLPLIHPTLPFSDSSLTSSLPGSMPYRQPVQVVNQTTASTTNTSHPVPPHTTGGGLKLKIRKVGDTMSIQSSEQAFTNTISSPSCSGSTDASSSSSNNTTPLSSHHASDAETAARRHAAIPPSFITNKIKAESPKSFFSSTQSAKLGTKDEPSPLPKAPKIRIKWDAHGKASTSFVSAEDSQLPPRPNITHERLRGSSISNEGSSSSSSRSQSSYDEEETRPPPPSPPKLPMLIPCIPLLSRPLQPPALPPLADITARIPNSAFGQPPPQLKPLHIDLPPLPKIDPLPTPLSSTQSSSNRTKSKRKTSKRKYIPSPPALPKLDLINPPMSETNISGSRRRIFPEVYSDDSMDEEVANASMALTKKQSTGHAKRKQAEEPTERRQMLASGGSSYYTNSKGEKIWLCPLCGTSGGDMVGCDSCDDWYHFQCLGLTSAPETEKWFCPVCVRAQETAKKANSSSSKKHSGKHSLMSRHSRH
ncbi:hypothetical protein Aperf_G00000034576 [Anoplocephala perfoliata]